jgi:ABC-type multidrug transport system fused ATPase/permease subunit
MSSRPLLIKFSAFSTRIRPLHSRQPLVWILLKANSLDLFLDFSLTILSILFNYASPFFLKRILDAVSIPAAKHKSEGLFFQVLVYTRITDVTAPDPTRPLTPRELRAQALVYAVLALLCTVLKAQADLQHLWYGRRAATRARSELMAAIYDKALKRRDASGLAMKDKESKDDKKDEEKKEKTNADTGKIVNLMSGDANRVAMMGSMAFLIYVSRCKSPVILSIHLPPIGGSIRSVYRCDIPIPAHGHLGLCRFPRPCRSCSPQLNSYKARHQDQPWYTWSA